MAHGVGKPAASPPAAAPAPVRRLFSRMFATAPLLSALVLAGCGTALRGRVVRLQDLEAAPALAPPAPQRCLVSDSNALRALCQPLGRRMGIIQVRTRPQWELLARCVSQLGPCPDLRHGMLVGLTSEAGTPLDRAWPFQWDAIHVYAGAGLVEVRFHGGNYLPDGATWLETAYVEGLEAVLAVAVDGVWYYPS